MEDNRPVDFLANKPPRTPRQRSKKRPVFFILLIVILTFLGMQAITSFFSDSASNNPNDYDPVTLEPKAPEGLLKRLGHFVFSSDVKLEGEKNDRINVLLLGMGGVGHDGPFLTDTIMIVSIEPSTGKIAMISIPRDLGVEIPGHNWNKINHANAFGEADKTNWGAALSTEVVEKTFDIDINYYVRVDFAAFKEIIDEIGGINVNVDRSFTDEEFPADDHEFQSLTFFAGEQIMSGDMALKFARSRHGNNGEGSDFARARRQQKVILALKEKMLSFSTLANPIRINNVVKSLDRHITTNMEFADIIAMVKLVRGLNTENIITLVLDTAVDGFLENSYTEDGAFVLLPKAGEFDEINDVIESIFTQEDITKKDDTPKQATPNFSPANIEIQNATWRAGLAARTRAILGGQSLTISSIGNSEERPLTKSGIYSLNSPATDVLQALKEEMGIPIKQVLPEGVQPATTTDILIILGEDYNEN